MRKVKFVESDLFLIKKFWNILTILETMDLEMVKKTIITAIWDKIIIFINLKHWYCNNFVLIDKNTKHIFAILLRRTTEMVAILLKITKKMFAILWISQLHKRHITSFFQIYIYNISKKYITKILQMT